MIKPTATLYILFLVLLFPLQGICQENTPANNVVKVTPAMHDSVLTNWKKSQDSISENVLKEYVDTIFCPIMDPVYFSYAELHPAEFWPFILPTNGITYCGDDWVMLIGKW